MSLSKSLPKGQVPIPCELCEVSFQIQWKCLDCKLLLCSKCKENIHPRIKLADKHKILKIKDITSDDLEDKLDLASVTCNVHDDKLCCLYCADCDEAICLLCITQTHTKHSMIELCEGYNICIKNVNSFTTQIDERIASIKFLEKKRYEDEKFKIMMQEQKLIKAIQSQTQILHRELDGHWINFRKELDASIYNRENIKIKSRIIDKEGHWDKSEEDIGSEQNDLKITTRIFDSVIHSRDANETFRVAREGMKMVNEEIARITADIGLPPTFIPRMVLSTSIESVPGWLKDMHTRQPVVAAIEIGANTVGAALCLRSNYYKYLNKDVNSPIEMVISTDKKMYDIPRSCVLLQPNGKVHSIGQEALCYYNENAKVITDWYFFDRLGEIFDEEKNVLTHDTWLEESRNYTRCELKKMKAIDVLAAVLCYIKEKILSKLSMVGAGNTFYSEDILWVITKPTMRAEQFIRDAAKKADISNEIAIIHEPDALSEFCASRLRKLRGFEPQTEIGDKYLVFNLGDGTTDITLHEITGPRFVKEIYRGDSWKGNALVCGEVLSILNQIFCQNVGSILKESYNSEYIDLISNIEDAIKRFELESTEKISMRYCQGTFKELTSEPLRELLSHSSFNQNVNFVGDKFRFTASFFQSLFESAINYASGMLDTCISAINNENLSEITTLLVVFDCLKSPILIDIIKRKFEPTLEVIVLNADTTVLDGALLRGFQ